MLQSGDIVEWLDTQEAKPMTEKEELAYYKEQIKQIALAKLTPLERKALGF